jgi:hypothetical protein
MMGIAGKAIKNILVTKEWDKIITTLSKVNVRVGYHGFKTSRYLQIREILDQDPTAAYAFLSAEKNHPTFMIQKAILGSKYSHAGILMRGTTPDDVNVIHITGSGMNVEHVLDLIDKVDTFVLIKLPISEKNLPKFRERVIDSISKKEEYKYDTAFRMEDDTQIVYCSEYVFNMGKGLVDDKDFKPHWETGIKVFAPDDLPDCGTVVFSE